MGGEVAPADGEHIVSVADLARLVQGNEPVAIAIEGQADVGTARAHPRGQALGMQGAGPHVDVEAIGPRPVHGDPGAQGPEELGGDAIRRPVSAVEDHRETGEVEGERLPRMRDVVRLRPVIVHEPAHVLARRLGGNVAAVQAGLDLAFPAVGELGALR